MSSILIWFIAAIFLIFLFRTAVKKYMEWGSETNQTTSHQTHENRIYSIDDPATTATTTQAQQYYQHYHQNRNSLYYDDQPPPLYTEIITTPINGENDSNGEIIIRKEIIIRSDHSLPTYDEVIQQAKAQQNCNNGDNIVVTIIPATSSTPTSLHIPQSLTVVEQSDENNNSGKISATTTTENI